MYAKCKKKRLFDFFVEAVSIFCKDTIFAASKFSIGMSTLRFKVVEEAYGRKAVPVEIPKERPSEYYAKYVFNRAQMYRYLDRNT